MLFNSFKIIKLLVEKGCDIHDVIYCINLEILKYLHENGGILSSKNFKLKNYKEKC